MTIEQFWPEYLSAHKKKATRVVHAIGLVLAYIFGCSAIISHRYWYLAACPMVAYSFAWSAHFWIEGNVPETFKHPLLSIVCDHAMVTTLIFGIEYTDVEKV